MRRFYVICVDSDFALQRISDPLVSRLRVLAAMRLMKETLFIPAHPGQRSHFMDASPTTSALQPGRGRVFDSIVDAIGNTPIVRLRRLPQANGVNATILAKLEYFNPAASV